MIKRIANKLYYTLVPLSLRKKFADRALLGEALKFKRECDAITSWDEVITFHRQSRMFMMQQNQSEITELCNMLSSRKPRIVCEIGARRGGSTSLYTRVLPQDAKIFSIDLNSTPGRMRAVESFARGNQQVKCFRADSHSPETLALLKQHLAGNQIDFLFIDGDHTYEGVKQDFEMYTPLVKAGGLVALHDIAPDHFTRFGKRTSSDVGEVPRYWQELKNNPSYTTRDLIDSPDQDGFGIGVIEWKGGGV